MTKPKMNTLVIALLTAGAAAAIVLAIWGPKPATANHLGKATQDPAYVVSVRHQGRWVEAGRLAFTRFYATRTLDLGRHVQGQTVRVRLEKRGGGEAHIDAATLGGRPPLTAGRANLIKLATVDQDVVDAKHPLELLFPAPAGRATLSLRARIEPRVISKTPFLYPPQNTHRPMTVRSAFYTYAIGSSPGRLAVDGDLGAERLGTPFFAEWQYCGSGHPQGTVYGWVRDDGEHLYVAIDFTPDNTIDGEEDYATVYARVDGQLRSFRITQSRRRWGRAGFTWTDKVGYQHKVYEFEIPLHRLTTNPTRGTRLALAFAAYGTAAAGLWNTQIVAFEPTSQTYAVRFWSSDRLIDVRLWNALATPVHGPVDVQLSGNQGPLGGIGADPVNSRFLVTWDENDGAVWGRLVNAGGTPAGSAFMVSDNLSTNANSYTYNSRVTYDPDQSRFLVTWNDGRTVTDTLYGRFLQPDGTPVGASFAINGADLYDFEYTMSGHNVAYNGASQEYLVVFILDGDCLAWRLNATTGATAGSLITLTSECTHPNVAFEPTSGNYLAAWTASGALESRIVHAGGTLEPVQVLADFATFDGVGVGAVSSPGGRFLVASDNGLSELWARFVDAATGAPQGAAIQLGEETDFAAHWAGIATNPVDHNFGVACFNTSTMTDWLTVLPTPHVSPREVVTAEYGFNDTFSVSLALPPTGPVVFDVVSTDTTEATVFPAMLTFDATNYDQGQTVTVYGQDDTIVDGHQPYAVTVTVRNAQSAPEYWDLAFTVDGTNLDDDAGLDLSPASVVTTEDGGIDSFEVTLPWAPAAAVVLDLAVSDDTEASINVTTMTFTRLNHDQPQTVTVTGLDDSDCDGDVSYTVSVTVRNADSDPLYHDIVGTVSGVNQDNETDVCGNGVVECDEECDDGNNVSGDGCSATCEDEDAVCGNGVREGTEECDDGNNADGDGCDSNCRIEGPVCGDGVREGTEECDDGNTIDGDGCDSNCRAEPEEDSNCDCWAAPGGRPDLAVPILLLFAFLLLQRRRRT